ncbi:MAG: hypothetical protein M3R15_29885, partial [Acidobacteriota bacterium]|nr:hypothetical protein [Acidobacteriota bacterium]
MQPFSEWYQSKNIDPDKTWLILGKGPSFSKRDEYDLSRFNTLSLNHVVREQPVMVAHMIDYEVIDACGEAIEKNAEVLVMPWVPHVNGARGTQNLSELLEGNAILRRMERLQRLLWYNLSAPFYD